MKHVSSKVFCGSVLAAATYLAVTCPCETYLECHREKFLALLAVAAVFAVSNIKTPGEGF